MESDYISLEGDPDDVAAKLLAPHLPPSLLDSIRIDSDFGIAELLMHLTHRMGRASIEKDELIRFVDMNRAALKSGRLAMMDKFLSAAKATDENYGHCFQYFIDNVRLAFAGRTSEMDMRSDKLFWLVFALSHQLTSNKISYEQVRAKLSRPEVVRRISRHQLFYMVHDYVESLETPQEPPQTVLIVTGECALLGDEPKIVQVVAELLAKHLNQKYQVMLISFLTRAADYLARKKVDVAPIRAALSTLNAKSQGVVDDDF